MLRIIDNKRINLTDSEYKLYQEICQSYNTATRKGEDLFKDLFETNEHGIIIFLRPPSRNYSSMEVFMFLISIFIHQHIGTACEYADKLITEMKIVLNESKQILEEMKQLRDELKK